MDTFDPTTKPVPQRQWAVKIMEKIRAGIHVHPIAEQYAKEALGLDRERGSSPEVREP